MGVDENGLGPVLGPLIVTGVAFAIEGERPRNLGALVGDSKALCSHEDASLGEAWARALLGAIGPEPQSSSEVLARLSLDDDGTLRALCPTPREPLAGDRAHAPSSMCWPAESEPFTADEALVRRCQELVRGWSGERVGGRFVRRTPMRVLGLRSAIVCASRMNAAAKEGRHRFLVDLHEMERLSLQLHEDGRAHPMFAPSTGEPTRAPLLDAVCGKVGGMDFYGDYFGPLSHRMWSTEAEGNGTSAYRFPGLGRFTFLQDADASDPLVGLASIVGKWVRELLMARIVRYLRSAALPEHLPPAPAGEPLLPNASGYRDPSTKRLIAATELVRAHRGIPDRCFQR